MLILTKTPTIVSKQIITKFAKTPKTNQPTGTLTEILIIPTLK